MNDAVYWFLTAVVAAFVILTAVHAFFVPPECPESATAKLTRDGWYCTVPPKG